MSLYNADAFALPSKKAIEETVDEFKAEIKSDDKETVVNYSKPMPNYADDAEFSRAFHNAAYTHFQRVSSSSTRSELMKVLADADAKFRVAVSSANKYTSGSTQKQNTLNQCASTQFYRTVKLIAAGQKSMIFSDPDDIPIEYVPVAGCKDYSPEEGQRISKWQQLYLKNIWQAEAWTSKIKRFLLNNAKNSMHLISLEWEKEDDFAIERVPGYYTKDGRPVEWDKQDNPSPETKMYDSDGEVIESLFDENGMPTSYVFVEKKRTIKNGPVLGDCDLRNVWMDYDLDDVQQQTIIAIRSQVPLQELINKQKQGYYKNVERIGEAHLYTAEDVYDNDDLKQSRLDNAGRSINEEANGLIDVMHIWFRASVKCDDKKEKAEWDNDAVPQIFEAVLAGRFGEYAGNLDDKEAKANGCVFLQIRKNPYFHKKYPYFMMHSHDDETGLIRMGYLTLLQNNVEQQTTRMNQWMDNVELRVRAPWIAEKGNVLSRDLYFRGGNDVKFVKSGTGKTALTKLDVPDVTARIIEEMGMLQEDADNTVGTTNAYKGMFAGARTTRTEYVGAREQALMPAVEDAHAVFDDFGEWLGKTVLDLSRQYGDPDEKYVVDGEEINITQLYGRLMVRITGIENYTSSYAARQAIISFMQSGGLAAAMNYMGKEGAIEFFRTVWKLEKMPNVDKIFPEVGKYVEAENQAWSDYQRILAAPEAAINDEANTPKEGERHEIHMRILKSQLVKWQTLQGTLPEEKQDYAQKVMAALKFYILMHEQLKQQEAAGVMAGGGQAMLPEMAGGGGMAEQGGLMDSLSGVGGEGPGAMAGGQMPVGGGMPVGGEVAEQGGLPG